MAARCWTAPLGEVARRVPKGRVLEVGCGHGAVTALLAKDPSRQVLAIDPDARKIAWARQALAGLANVEVRCARVEELDGQFDAAVIADVLYLFPVPERAAFLSAVRKVLVPGGRLVLLDAEADGSWRHRKALFQEWVMVNVLRKTHGSGGLAFQTREELLRTLEATGFHVDEVASLSRGYTTPHVLFTARLEPAS